MPGPVNAKWVDIVTPTAPAHMLTAASVVFLVLIMLALSGLVFVNYRNRRARARRELRNISRTLDHSQADGKTVCMQIRECLRNGFNQRQLHSIKWPDDYDARWHLYVDKLAEFSFADSTPPKDELRKTIHEAREWLDTKRMNS